MSGGAVPYALCAALSALGLHAMMGRPNLMRKLMGFNVLQTAVILLYLCLGARDGSVAPILGSPGAADGAVFSNPLPHALMLTAIVVGVSTTGVALALLLRIHRRHGTLEEPEILEDLRRP